MGVSQEQKWVSTCKYINCSNIHAFLHFNPSTFSSSFIPSATLYVAPELLVDGRYQHWEFISVHLQFLAFLAQDGGIYLPLKRAAEVWDVLIQNPNACADDRAVSNSGMILSLCVFNHPIPNPSPLLLSLALTNPPPANREPSDGLTKALWTWTWTPSVTSSSIACSRWTP